MTIYCSCISLSGGQGKTTTIFFLAQLLSKARKKVLVIDTDPQSNLSLFFSKRLDPSEPSLLEGLMGEVEISHCLYPTPIETIGIVPSDRSLFKAHDFLSSSGAGASLLRRRIKPQETLFDFILIDASPARSQLTMSALGAADRVIIPVECNTKGVNSLVESLSFVDQQANLGSFDGQVVGVLPFRDRWTGLSQTKECREAIEAIKAIAEQNEIKAFPSVRESTAFVEACRRGRLISGKNADDLQYPFLKIIEELTDG